MKIDKKWDIIGFGNIAVDDLLFVPSYPQSNTKNEVDSRLRQGGGLAGTALVAASRLGARTAYCGALGHDELSEFTLQEFREEKVSVELCFIKDQARPIYSTIIVDQCNGNRTIFYTTEGFQPPPLKKITAELLNQSKLIFLDSYLIDIVPHIIKIAHQNKIPILADIENDNIMQFPKLLDKIDFLIFSRDLAAKITGEKKPQEILAALQSPARQCTVITAGRNGCWFMEKNKSVFHLPAFRINEVDTTGCGDVFHGAFAAAWIRNEDIINCVIQASAAAAIKATQVGGRKGIPDLNTLLNFIRDHSDNIPDEVI